MNKKIEKIEKKSSKYYKHPVYGHVYLPKIVTPMGRLSWPCFVAPKKAPVIEGQAPSPDKYEGTILLDKSEAKVTTFLEKLEASVKEALVLFNEGKKGKLSELQIVKDGDSDFDFDKYPSLEHYKSNYVLVGKNAEVPNLLSLDKDPKGDYLSLSASFFKGGHLVRFVATPIITTHGVSFKLNDVQYIRDDGTRFGGAIQNSVDLLAENEAEITSDLSNLSDYDVNEEDTSLQTAIDNL